MNKDVKTSDKQVKASRVGGFELTMVGGYVFDEVASAFQKSIRRSEEYNACYFAYIMHLSGYYNYIWKRLFIITSEDIGNANPLAASVVHSLKANYDYCVDSKTRQSLTSYTILFQAVQYLCRSFKTRECDSLANLIDERFIAGELVDIPDYSIDPHTERGKRKYGKWNQGTKEEIKIRYRLWVNEWCKTTPHLTCDDLYMQPLKELWGIADEQY